MNGYYEVLKEYYESMQEAASKATERGMKVSREMMDEFARRQQEMAEVGRRLAAGEDLKNVYPAILQSTVAAQTGALKLYQTLQEESMGAYVEARESMEELVQAAMEFAETAAQETRAWGSSSPFGWAAPGGAAASDAHDAHDGADQ